MTWGHQFWTSRIDVSSLHCFQLYFNKCVPKSLKSLLFYSFRFLEKLPKTKRFQNEVRRVAFSEPSQGVHFEHKYKHGTKRISQVSVLLRQMCVLVTKILFTAYSFSLGQASSERPKTPKGNTPCVTSLGRPQDVNLIIIHKIFFRKIFLYFLMPSLYQTLRSLNKLKT